MHLVGAADHGLEVLLGGTDCRVAQNLHQPLTAFRQMRLKGPLHCHLQQERLIRWMVQQGELARSQSGRLSAAHLPEAALGAVGLLPQEAEQGVQVSHMAGGRAGRRGPCAWPASSTCRTCILIGVKRLPLWHLVLQKHLHAEKGPVCHWQAKSKVFMCADSGSLHRVHTCHDPPALRPEVDGHGQLVGHLQACTQHVPFVQDDPQPVHLHRYPLSAVCHTPWTAHVVAIVGQPKVTCSRSPVGRLPG
jgi:hypothetical protein